MSHIITKLMPKRARATLALGMSSLVLSAAAALAEKSIVYVTPNPIGNNPFLVQGENGTQAAGEAIGAKVSTYESDAPSAMLENLYAAANEGASIIVAISFSAVDGVMEVAPTAPDTQFLLVDACPASDKPQNVHCAVFREHESSFLMGAMAGLTSQNGNVGIVAAIDIPFMHRFTDAFAAGAKHINPDISVETRWVGGQNPFSDPVRAKEQALTLNAQGADVIYAAAAGGNFGIFEAAAENGFKVMGVDSNLCGAAGNTMYDSALKGVDQAIMLSVKAIDEGARGGFASYGLAERGVGAVALWEANEIAASGCLIADQPEVAQKIRALADEIIAGEITVADPLMAQ